MCKACPIAASATQAEITPANETGNCHMSAFFRGSLARVRLPIEPRIDDVPIEFVDPPIEVFVEVVDPFVYAIQAGLDPDEPVLASSRRSSVTPLMAYFLLL
jgi:hypothetical protein